MCLQRKSKKVNAKRIGSERWALMGDAFGEVGKEQGLLKVLVRNFDISPKAMGSYPKVLSKYVT